MNTGIEKMDRRSRERLATVHPALRAVIGDAASRGIKFIVTEGIRTEARQRELFVAGASRTMHSKHLTGRAVDLAVVVNGEVRWDWPLYALLAAEVTLSASVLDIPVVWGGDWENFPDGPHFELAPSVV